MLLCHSWLLPLLLHVLLHLRPSGNHTLLTSSRALFVQKTLLCLLPSYCLFSFLLNQPQWRIFTPCNQISSNRNQGRNDVYWFCSQVYIQPLLYILPFSIQPSLTCLGMILPIADWAFLHQLAIKKMLHRHANKTI